MSEIEDKVSELERRIKNVEALLVTRAEEFEKYLLQRNESLDKTESPEDIPWIKARPVKEVISRFNDPGLANMFSESRLLQEQFTKYEEDYGYVWACKIFNVAYYDGVGVPMFLQRIDAISTWRTIRIEESRSRRTTV